VNSTDPERGPLAPELLAGVVKMRDALAMVEAIHNATVRSAERNFKISSNSSKAGRNLPQSG